MKKTIKLTQYWDYYLVNSLYSQLITWLTRSDRFITYFYLTINQLIT